ncbi:MAG TPA: FHA domain-containing protein [Caldimonas sp.]|jgi:hypothetical protein|nr:FHA domain-containing protein [Caldimonas sp.]HEX2543117.1 FHA domain-containing protein [Caldimonas sp.]
MGEVGDRALAAAAEAGHASEAVAARHAPLALLEAVDRDGMVRQAWRVERWPFSIGRALDNDAVLTEPHVAAHHATLDIVGEGSEGAGEIVVTAGETRNGLSVGRERVAGGASRRVADTGRDLDLHIGRTHLRLRLPGHALAPELAMAAAVGREHHWLPTVGLALAVLAAVLFNTWIDTDPDTLARTAGTVLLTTILAGAMWCGLWALLSKTFSRQSHFAWHVRVFVVATLVTLTLSVLPPLLAFSLSWPWIADFSFVAVYATVAAAIYFHLLAVEPGRQGLMRAVTVTGFATAVALSIWFNVQRTGRPGEELYMNHLFPPQLRAATPVPVEQFVQGLAPMQAILDRKAKERSGSDIDTRGLDDDE